MSNKSGVSSQVISLPKGGGALQGIGEKFAVDPHTGTGNFTVPITLPSGRNGFQPELSLVYSSGNGNGPFGLGWSLSVPGVSRKTSEGVPLYDDSEDTFILSGAEDLVPVPGASQGTTRYRPRTEGLFARIDHHRTDTKDYWEVRSKDGLVSYYGTEPNDRPPDAGTEWEDPATVVDPSKRDKVFAWKLTKTEDPFDNRILYAYEPDRFEDGFHKSIQPYLKAIRYVDYEDDSGNDLFLVSVTLVYEDELGAKQRPDPFSDYRAGFEIRTRRRCKRIEIRTHADKDPLLRGDGTLVRSYELTYLDERDASGEFLGAALPPNRVSLLSQVTITGHDEAQEAEEDRTQQLPPLEFGYTRFEPEKRDLSPLEGNELPARSLANPELELADLFGNGLPDFLEMSGAVRYWRNLGSGRFDLPREMRNAPADLQLADPGVQMIDADGDGRIDLLTTANGLSGYFPLRFGGLWDRHSFQRYELAPSFNLEDPEVRLVDLNGDGVTDAIRSGTRLECFFNDPKEGWNETRFVERQSPKEFPDIDFSDPRVKLADITGDGLQEVVLVYDGNVEYWPNLGHGDWGRRISMHNSPRFPHGHNPRRILTGDVDGDGAADIVYVDDTKVTLWVNRSGNGWSDPIEIKGTPPVSDMDAVRLADMLGTGIGGVLWSADANGLARNSMFFLDFAGAVKPYVLSEMNNHMGALTRVGYAPSTRFYREDEKRPSTRWKTPLPFPVQVVSRVEVIDDISKGKLTTEYRYHHGYWDGAEREFRGFGMVEQLDTETFEDYNKRGFHGDEVDFVTFEEDRAQHFSPPTLTKTWFHLGPAGDEFGEWEEADYTDEFWPDDPVALPRSEDVKGFLDRLPRRAERDALRALAGRVLRTELYALDGTDRPYTVTEYLHGVTSLPVGRALPEEPEEWQTKVFFPHSLAQRTSQWERGEEPMTQFAYTEDYDEYGQPCRQIQIACPRGWRDIDESVSKEYLSTCSETMFAQRDDDEKYIVDRVATATSYEIATDEVLTVPQLKEIIVDGSAKRHVIGQTLNLYDGEPFTGEPSGEIGEHGALMRTETLVLNEDILRKAYGDEVPPYLAPSGLPAFTPDYPQEFRNLLPIKSPSDLTRAGLTITPVGYGFAEGGQNSPFERGYFVATERRRYDFNDGPGGRGLLTATCDPLGSGLPGSDTSRETSIAYDDFDLLPIEVVMPKGSADSAELKTEAVYDYRVLQPSMVIDPNGSRQTFGFTQLGLPAQTAVMGKDGEGDTEGEPSILFEYSFQPFVSFRMTSEFLGDLEAGTISAGLRKEFEKNGVSLSSSTIIRAQAAGSTWLIVDNDRAYTVTKVRGELVVGGQPISVRTIRRVQHANDSDVPLEERNETIETVEYSDGFGRLLQTRTQAEDVIFGDPDLGGHVLPPDQSHPAGDAEDVVGQALPIETRPRVVVSGWQTYDNKGRVVEKYEPFFSQGWAYAPPSDLLLAKSHKATMFYDPRGQVVQTVNPDSSEQRVIYGEPLDINDPERLTPTPWKAYTYDANDNAGRTHPADAAAYANHWNTPSSVVVDALGRTVEAVERNGDDPVTDRITTLSTYDIRGNLLSVTDVLGREAFRHVYDLADNPLRTENLDAGIRRTVLDAAGNLVEGRDSMGALTLHAYDALNRPIRLWARDGTDQQLTLREHILYGDDFDSGLNRTQAREANLLGKAHKHYDEAGLTSFAAYDFKGNLLEKTRRVIADEAILTVFDHPPDFQVQAFRVNWQPPDGKTLETLEDDLLDKTDYQTNLAYDALDRVKKMLYPEDVEGERKELHPRYNRAGALEHVELDGETFVEHIAYNAKGQRTLLALGNSVMARYSYDKETFRLLRLRSERYTKDESHTYRPRPSSTEQQRKRNLLQDFAYEIDLIGNIVAIHDRTPESGIPNSQLGNGALDRAFTYDPLYRLIFATGREHDIDSPKFPWTDEVKSQDVTKTRRYTETYRYDRVGNMKRLRHAAKGGSFTRRFALAPKSNRLDTVSIGNETDKSFDYVYDANGNLVQEHAARHFEWDYSDRMKAYRTQAGASEPSVYAHYLYDSSGQRVKKLVRKRGQIEVTVYVDGVFEHRQVARPSATRENNALHVMDDQDRIALVRVGDPFPNDAVPAIKYHLGDHLGSSNLVVDQGGSFVNREEYAPYGETSFGSFARKRYRFTGKERDEESGLYYHGVRFYAPWLTRWISTDPAGMMDGMNLYQYARANPNRFSDPTGAQALPGTHPPTPGQQGARENPIIVNSLENLPLEKKDRPRALQGRRFYIKNNTTGVRYYYRYESAGQSSNGTHVTGQADGRAGGSGSQSGQGGVPAPDSGPAPTTLEKLNKVLSFLDDPGSLANEREGVSGGIPGGMGPEKNASKIAQIAFAVFGVFSLAGGKILKQTLGWIGKKVGGFFRKAGGWLGNSLLGKRLANSWLGRKLGLGGSGGRKALREALGDLTEKEIKQIQDVVDEAGRPLEVVGSAARGGRGVDSDIDYLVPPSSKDYFRGSENRLPSIDPEHGLIPGTHNPHIGPAIRFEPGVPPRFIPAASQ